MTTLGDKLRARIGCGHVRPAPAPLPARRVFSFGQEPVAWSMDLARVLELPRRALTVDEAQVEALAKTLRRSEGGMSLRPVQALALLDAQRTGGLLGPIGVGAGKTLISLLLPTVLDAKVTVLLVPANLRSKVTSLEYPHLAREWRLPNLAGSMIHYPDTTGILHVVSYSQLSTVNGADVLDRLRPDLIVCDEAHALRHSSAARTKRFLRYFKARPETKLCALSGTMTSRSIKDFAHLAKLALRDGAPVPHQWPVLEAWAGALDAVDFPAPPGELTRMCRAGEDLREGFRRRLVETPGVVTTTDNRIGTSLVVSERKVAVPKDVVAVIDRVRETWTRPDGEEEFEDALTFSRCARQVSAGLYYRWVWPRGESEDLRRRWLDARREWHREVRSYLTYSARPGMDSPLLLARAASTGKWGSRSWSAWSRLKDQCEPEVEAVWIDPFLAQDAVDWGRETTAGIIWFEHDALGRKIAELGGFPFYGGGDEASAKIAHERGDRTIVASVRAHGTGKNLQAFSRALVTTPSTSGVVWEQLLGRLHRPGQLADEVTYEVYLHTEEMRGAVGKALRDAEYQAQVTGSEQKLRYADVTFAGTNGEPE